MTPAGRNLGGRPFLLHLPKAGGVTKRRDAGHSSKLGGRQTRAKKTKKLGFGILGRPKKGKSSQLDGEGGTKIGTQTSSCRKWGVQRRSAKIKIKRVQQRGKLDILKTTGKTSKIDWVGWKRQTAGVYRNAPEVGKS